MLLGQFDIDVIGADFLQAFVNDAVGENGTIAFAAEVSEIEVAQFGGHDFLGGIGGIFV